MNQAMFISHGAPDELLHDSPLRRFWEQDMPSLAGSPGAIVVASAHFTSAKVQLSAAVAPRTIHDFVGFDPALFAMRYPAAGDPELAGSLVAVLSDAGISAGLAGDRGLDHGTWVPLMAAFPDAQVPVLSLSVNPHAGPAHHFSVGRALASIGERNILLLGSGGLTHNLGELNWVDRGAAAAPWSREFAEWVARTMACGDAQSLLDYRRLAPYALRNHPTEEHVLPLFVAMGFAGEGWLGRRVFSGDSHSALALDAYVFESPDRAAV
jgi:4,5-DOPA dioxygenase extradiol